MDTKSLMELYEKMIQGQSDACSLINTKKMSSVKQKYSSSQLAKLRFSDQYLELLNNQKAFNQTLQALKHFYTTEHNIKPPQLLSSANFYHFLFQHFFSHSEKILLESMVQAEFSTNNSLRDHCHSQRAQEYKESQQQKLKPALIASDHQTSTDKHVFFQLLESIVWDEENQIEKRQVQKKQRKKEKTNEDPKQFSMLKMISMFM